jgi:Zn ribbon nucleic-acid-binding protein
MPLRDRTQSSKPLDEPFRKWDLERCTYCESWMGLNDIKCIQCGHWRSEMDSNMAARVKEYRQSMQGQKQYQLLENQENLRTTVAQWIGFVGIFVCTWPFFWIIGTLFWGEGAIFAFISSGLLATVVMLHL